MFNKGPPLVVLIADTPDFDEAFIQDFKDEGFRVEYMHYKGNRKTFHNQLIHLADPLDLGEKYAIVGSRLRTSSPRCGLQTAN